jgi:hypothetical protein
MNTVQKVWRKKEKKTNKLCRVSGEDTRQISSLPTVYLAHSTLGKGNRLQLLSVTDDALSSAHFCQELGSQQSRPCRVSFYAECSALGKNTRHRVLYFAECGTQQSMFCRVSDKLPSAKS